MNETNGVILLMGGGTQLYREYLVASAASGNRIWLFDPDEPTWQRPYIVGHDVLDVFDPAVAVAAARELAASRPVSGGEIVSAPSIVAYPALAAPPGLRGRYIAAITAAMTTGYALGPAVGTALYQLYGSAAWLMCAALGTTGRHRHAGRRAQSANS